ncbi:MAG: bacillithiol biosynthesis cysteine-adding enzyme BshC [Chitinophagaceae bacterium]|nr:bacillithiol biosynthesis cysteine-adding enzyme BshC [Chitinophagaceae bacterium]
MEQPANYISYESTGYFSRIVTDYLSDAGTLRPFYMHRPGPEGVRNAIAARKEFPQQRQVLVNAIREQYEGISISQKLEQAVAALADDHTFTVTTAHQPNIFTGPLYFIYKILHTIKLADELNNQFPGKRFVPVYYMGSEDADLEELGFVNVGGRRLSWSTKQTGAVGRMKVDKPLIVLMDEIHGQAGVLPFGAELQAMFRKCYTPGKTIQQATLELVNELFGDYGLVVLIPDNAQLKKLFQPVVEKELLEGFSHRYVSDTIIKLGAHYKVQAGGREINLFYLLDDKRERIELQEKTYKVPALGLSFTQEQILAELEQHPERFSANVILRGAFQETILPNIAFIGGGGELAYWLELRTVFAAVGIPYPVLLLRNSFLLLKRSQAQKIKALGFGAEDLFLDELSLLNKFVKRNSGHQLSLQHQTAQLHTLYDQLKQIAGSIDGSLPDHIASLQTNALKKIQELEKKLLRAERQKYETQQKQIAKLKQDLFPGNSLQERVDNFSLWYAQYGRSWLRHIYDASDPFNKGFGLIEFS